MPLVGASRVSQTVFPGISLFHSHILLFFKIDIERNVSCQQEWKLLFIYCSLHLVIYFSCGGSSLLCAGFPQLQ